jgi:hypothetical protein
MMRILLLTGLTWAFSATSLAYAETAPSAQAENLLKTNTERTVKMRKTNAQVWRTQRYEVQMIGDKIGSYRLIRKSDGFVHHVGHPYGHIDAKKLGKVKYYTVPQFRALAHALAKKERARLKNSKVVSQPAGRLASRAKTPTYTTGLGLGYNASTGYIGTGSQCFNEVTTLTQSVTSSEFSVSTGASSYADQTDVSASVSASYSFFSGDASASYSSNYQSGANAGSIFFSSVGLFSASNVWYGLNTLGTNNQASGDFSANCGSEFVESIAVGALVSANFTWSSDSSSASSAIQTAMTANASSGLSSISVAVSAGESSSSTSSHTAFALGTSSLGGGSIITEALANATSNNAGALDSCLSGTSSSCNTFAIGFNSDISQGISGTGGLIDTYEGSPADLSGLAVFPSPIAGVVGQPTIGLENISTLLSSSGYSDVFSSYSAQLQNYVNIYNQIRTLANRASYITGQMGNYESSALVVANYVSPLAGAYAADASSMLSNLGTCLTTATTSNVANVCAPIIALKKNGVTSAYDWYGSSGPNPNNYASYELTNLRNNTIALQYIGTFSDSNESAWSMDVAWIGELPPGFDSSRRKYLIYMHSA